MCKLKIQSHHHEPVKPLKSFSIKVFKAFKEGPAEISRTLFVVNQLRGIRQENHFLEATNKGEWNVYRHQESVSGVHRAEEILPGWGG